MRHFTSSVVPGRHPAIALPRARCGCLQAPPSVMPWPATSSATKRDTNRYRYFDLLELHDSKFKRRTATRRLEKNHDEASVKLLTVKLTRTGAEMSTKTTTQSNHIDTEHTTITAAASTVIIMRGVRTCTRWTAWREWQQ